VTLTAAPVRRLLAWPRLLGVLVILCAALGGLAPFLLLRDPGGGGAGTSRVELRTIRQTVPARVSFTFIPAGEVAAPASGTVTEVKTHVGDVAGRGRELLVVDGRALVAVNAPAPFTRELRRGDSGEDVAALQSALAEEGYYRDPETGSFDDATRIAQEAWQRVHNLPVTGDFDPRDVLVGTWPARVAEVLVTAGGRVEAGQAVIVLSESVATVGTLELVNEGDGGRVLHGMRLEWPGGGGMVEREGDGPLAVRFEGGGGYTSEVTSLDATVILRERDNALSVPVEAISREGEQAYVTVVAPQGGEQRIPVQTGVSDGTYIQVSGDLRVGDEVAIP
jgi:multidrug efflux pump subunit AcrA (membrane-fusion protein)